MGTQGVHVKMQAGRGVRSPPAREHQEPPKAARGEKGLSPGVFRTGREDIFVRLLSKTPGLWSFVAAATEKQYRGRLLLPHLTEGHPVSVRKQSRNVKQFSGGPATQPEHQNEPGWAGWAWAQVLVLSLWRASLFLMMAPGPAPWSPLALPAAGSSQESRHSFCTLVTTLFLWRHTRFPWK